MNCPMKDLLRERTEQNEATMRTATIQRNTRTATSQKEGVGEHQSTFAPCTDCDECCVVLAFKYIAACDDVVGFQRKVRELVKKAEG